MTTGGEDRVGFVRAEPALGVEAALRDVRGKNSWAGRRIDESMPVRKGRLVERHRWGKPKSNRFVLCRRSRED